MFQLGKSEKAFEEAKRYMPGGVNSPVRSYRSVGSNPPFISSASGSRIYDIDNNEYIDYVLSWGPMILGHANPEVIASLQEAIPRGTSYGAPTLLETELAKKVQAFMPSMEVIRLVNSGYRGDYECFARSSWLYWSRSYREICWLLPWS